MSSALTGNEAHFPMNPMKRKLLSRPAPLRLIISLDGVEFDITSKKDIQPLILSPIMTPTILRTPINITNNNNSKLFNNPPPTAPPNVTSFTIEDEIAEIEAMAKIKFLNAAKSRKTVAEEDYGRKQHKKVGGLEDDGEKEARGIAAQGLRSLLGRAKLRKARATATMLM